MVNAMKFNNDIHKLSPNEKKIFLNNYKNF